MPHQIGPGDFQAAYLHSGHAANSPGAGPATVFSHLQPGHIDAGPSVAARTPVCPEPGGVMQPAEQAGYPLAAGRDGPVFAGLSAHHNRVATRPPIPGGQS